MNDNLKIGFRDFFVALITAFTSIVASYFMFAGTAKQADAALVSSLHKQVQEQQVRMFKLQQQVTQLQIQLSQKYEVSDVLREYMDGMPFIAWTKVYQYNEVTGSSDFRYWHINDEYEDYFDVSLERFRNKTDFELEWPDGVAEQFYINDVETLRRRSYKCTPESFPTNLDNPVEFIETELCKWTSILNGNPAVSGLVPLIRDENGDLRAPNQ